MELQTKLSFALQLQKDSVADPGCLPWIPDPDFLPILDSRSQIPDLGSQTQNPQQKRGVIIKLLSYLFCRHKFHKIGKKIIFETLKIKIWPSFQRILFNFLPKNLSLSSKNMGLGSKDLRSGIQKKPIPDPDPGPGVKKALDPGSGIWICNTAKRW
jgi:hypothetical protein